jgi:16S rRNA (adenine1518-N6/adenine1519-N6)-dimethyltransferase
MTLDQLPPLRETLAEHGLLAKKSFGQHFLLDLNITRKIARLAQVGEGDHVIEVGPGPGGLTRALLETGARVTAIEADRRFAPLLEELSAAAGGALTLRLEDALTTDDAALAAGAPAHMVSNLPYNVGTPLLIRWLTGAFTPASMTLMFQKEVADRIAAQVGDEAYGRLSVLAQATSHAEVVMDVPARAFTPPPTVASAVARLTPRADRPAADRLNALQQVTRRGLRPTPQDAEVQPEGSGRRGLVRRRRGFARSAGRSDRYSGIPGPGRRLSHQTIA